MKTRVLLASSLVMAVIAAPAPVLAQDDEEEEACPEPPIDTKVRRTLAKDWFGKAQAYQKRGNEVAAVRAFSCSLRMVPHPFTAYNLAMAAERTGDLELAVESYRRYLELSPEAEDKAEVEQKIAGFEAKIAKLRGDLDSRNAAKLDSAGSGAGGTSPPDVSKPGSASEPQTRSGRYKIAAWSTLGGGGLVLATGAILNVMARGKMDDCRSLWEAKDAEGSDAACASAKTYAYGSYALLGVGAAALLAGGTLLYMDRAGTTEAVAFAPAPGGGLITLAGRF